MNNLNSYNRSTGNMAAQKFANVRKKLLSVEFLVFVEFYSILALFPRRYIIKYSSSNLFVF